MFKWLTDKRKTQKERQQEMLSAYLDGALSPRERVRLEQALAQDTRLRADLDELRLMVQRLRSASPAPLPRSFVLDPAVYGRTQPRRLWYPVLQAAAVVTTILFMFIFAGGWLFSGLSEMADSISLAPQPVVREVIVTQIVEKEVVVTEIVEVAGEEKIVEKEVVVTEIVEVEVESIVMVTATPEPAEEVEFEAVDGEEPAAEEAPEEPEPEPTEEGWQDSADAAGTQAPPAEPAKGLSATPTEAPLGGSAGTAEPSPAPWPTDLPPTPTDEFAPTATLVPTKEVKVVQAPTVTPGPTATSTEALTQEQSNLAYATEADDEAREPSEKPAPQPKEYEQPIEIDWGLAAKIGLGVLVLGLFVVTWLARRLGW